MSDIDEKQLVLYAQMFNLVNLLLHFSEINIREIAEKIRQVCGGYVQGEGERDHSRVRNTILYNTFVLIGSW